MRDCYIPAIPTIERVMSHMQTLISNDHEWWRSAIIYQIYPRSFMDSNGDGIGDLPGITQRLGYVADLGVDAVWISPFFRSPMKDFGYDISNFYDVDPMFGHLADFDALVAEADRLGLRIMIDMVLNHTSDQHPWFLESSASRDNPKADWYVWADPKIDGTPPNNWLSIFGGCSWQWHPTRRQYYLHNFLRSQPDLNYHNPEVQDEMLRVMRFWLDRGVKGFRLDAVNFYLHDKELRNNPPYDNSLYAQEHVHESNNYAMQHHIYDQSRPENLAFLARIREVLDEYPGTTSVAEIGAFNGSELIGEYTRGDKHLHMGYSFGFLNERFDKDHICRKVREVESYLGDGCACWAFANHDAVRPLTRWKAAIGKEAQFTRMMLTLLLCLRGSVCVYQGEELGLPEADLPYEAIQDPYGIEFWPEFKGRDGCRTPIPWHRDEPYAGFSTVKPWLPVPEIHKTMAVDQQTGEPESLHSFFRELVTWRRQQPALLQGEIAIDNDSEMDLLIVTRYGDQQRLRLYINLSADPIAYHLPNQAMRLMESQPLSTSFAIDGNQLNLAGYGACWMAV